MVAILDYGVGNIGSIINMLKYIGENSCVTRDKNVVLKADRIILPGVGKFDTGMKGLINSNLDQVIREMAIKGIPMLGICLGMQLLMERSDEGDLQGLGIIEGSVKRFNENLNVKVPHMGWNWVTVANNNSIISSTDLPAKFYFAHSYYVVTERKEDTILKSNYGIDFAAGIQKDNVFGVQFHPEKSHKYGVRLLKRFCEV